MKIQTNFFFLGGGRGSGGGRVRLGGQGGCERIIEVFVKIQNKNSGGGVVVGGGSGWGRQGGGDLRIKVFGKIRKKKKLGGGGSGGGGSGWWGGVRVDVNEELKFL